MTDSELVKMLKGSHKEAEEAFTEIYKRYSSQVHSYCVRISNTAEGGEDIFQETFIRFYQNIKPDCEITNVPGYLITIARNLHLNSRRNVKQHISIDDFEIPYIDNNSLENKDLLNIITVALDMLDFDYREAFILREYDGLQYNEIAEITNTSLSNAKSRVFRAKQKIKDLIAPYIKEING